MNPNLGYYILRVTEEAAIFASKWRGRQDKIKADDAATTAMRNILNTLPIKATVVIGEGEMDEAPMLYNGEVLGTGGEELDIAVDPLDGTTLTAKNRENAITVIAIAPKGALLKAPDIYMLKIGVGPRAKGAINLAKSLTENLKEIAKALNKKPEDMNIVMLDRDRHNSYIKEVKAFGARLTLITDGDVSPVIGAGLENIDIDVLFGSGGAPEGVLGAAAAKCLGGDFQGKLLPENDEQVKKCQEMGITDTSKIFTLGELIKTEHVIFSLTGVTIGYLTHGVKKQGSHFITDSLLLNSKEKIIRRINSYYPI